MAAEIFIQRFPVDAADIDELGHVNNIVYLRYAQEIAIAHWSARATPEMIANYVWVVLRHEADYRAALALGDEIEVRTWVDDAPQGAAWTRFVEIRKAGAEKPSAQIKSNWALLDAKTRRVKRVPQEIVARFRA
jgi:acyl-CoA thioester hydrolase